jgi:UDP-N-acetylglucosamine--N-acetylmuramyl-(pentapeptide) pyrophosphoryl-undecaprenol N-acetylglucosamine transferase
VQALRFMVAGGGTGGHVFPGIAVADALDRRVRDLSVCWVGTSRGIEARVLPSTPWRFEPMDLAGLNGVRGKKLVAALAKLPPAAGHAWRVLRRERPHVVLGVGGYAGGPVVAMAASLRIPTAVLEPNAVPGLTNRILSRMVKAAFVTHEETLAAFPAGVGVVTGSPVRRAFLARMASPVPTGGDASVLVLGGSQGARAINAVMPEAVSRLRAAGLALRVTHQTGAAERDAVAAAYAARGEAAEVVAFIDDVATVMAESSLVVCRAGAMTVAELGVLGRPAVYIPLPTAADDHQRKNAEAMAARGAARWVAQPALTAERLAEEIGAALRDGDALQAMGAAAWSSARPDAAGVIADALLALAGGVGVQRG